MRIQFYILGVICISLSLIFINEVNHIVTTSVAGFPIWLIPFLCACIAAGIGGYVWSKIREVDNLKYEFITIVTHKFRTPLTYVKWSVDNMTTDTTEENRQHVVHTIRTAVTRLSELTDLLVGLEKTDASQYSYSFKLESLFDVMEKVIKNDRDRMTEKNIVFVKNFSSTPVMAAVDARRLEFALQIFLENAITYTPAGGAITVSVSANDTQALVSVKDSGIGIAPNELPYIFSKFFRGIKARLADTEGMGIGLYVAHDIIQRQNGTISVHSEGLGKGSTFTVSLPLSS